MAVTDVHAILDIGVILTTRKSVSVSIWFLFNSNSTWRAIAFFFITKYALHLKAQFMQTCEKKAPSFHGSNMYMKIIYSSFEATEVNAINVLL